MSVQLNFEVVSLGEVPGNDVIPLTDPPRHVVLIVDDEHVIADTLSIILSRNGYTVLTAYDGKTALELAGVVPPELLITDVIMPGMTGIELAIALVEAIPDCKVLLFSGQAATNNLLLKARDTGHDFTLLAKPIHPTNLLKRISESLGKREMIAMSPADEVADSNSLVMSVLD